MLKPDADRLALASHAPAQADHEASRSDHQRLQRREAVLAAAAEVFDRLGYAGATVDAVAAKAGVGKGTIFNYFNSKAGLFEALFEHAVSTSEADVDALLAQPGPAATKLERLLGYWHERLAHHKRIGRLVLEFWATAAREGRAGELTAQLQSLTGRFRKRLEAVLAGGVAEGVFRDDFDLSLAASLLMAMLDGVELHGILGIGVKTDERFLETLNRAVRLSLSRPNGGK